MFGKWKIYMKDSVTLRTLLQIIMSEGNRNNRLHCEFNNRIQDTDIMEASWKLRRGRGRSLATGPLEGNGVISAPNRIYWIPYDDLSDYVHLSAAADSSFVLNRNNMLFLNTISLKILQIGNLLFIIAIFCDFISSTVATIGNKPWSQN